MALIDLVTDTAPSSGASGVPLRATLSFTLSGTNYRTGSLEEGMFVEGPDTDQFIGPGGAYQRFPDGISQGDLDDLLESPGYKGIVTGSVAVTTGANTTVTFTPTNPLFALTTYKLYLSDVEETDGTEISGIVTVEFTTGSGSIEEVPTDVSTSVLATTTQASRAIDAISDLSVVSTTPVDHAIQQNVELEEILVKFNKPLDSSSVSASDVKVETIPVTDHPNVTINTIGELAVAVEVDGETLKIKI